MFNTVHVRFNFTDTELIACPCPYLFLHDISLHETVISTNHGTFYLTGCMYMTCEHTNENSILLSCEMLFYRHCIRRVLFRCVFCSEHHSRFYLERLFHKLCNGMVFLPYVFCNVCLDCHSRWLFYGRFGIRKTLSRCLMLFVV